MNKNIPKKIFIDTNIFIRFLSRDNEIQYIACENIFKRVEAGEIRPYISSVVIMEIIFVLERLYGFSKQEIVKTIKKVLLLRNIVVIENTNTIEALKVWELYKIKFGDCLISTQIPKGMLLITYDNEFKHIKSIKSSTPDTI